MRYLFSPEGNEAIDALLARRPLLAFDFDGTLAPIVGHPDDACVPQAVSDALSGLAALRPVAVITGRSVNDVQRRLGFTPAYVIGNHGAEGLPGAPADRRHLLDPLRQQLRRRTRYLQRHGVMVEDKGGSLALHYRLAADRPCALRAIEAVLVGLDEQLEVFGGKLVMNVVPASSPDKGDAVIHLVAHAGCDAALFIGDDVNDEAVFRVAAPDWLTVRIGRDEPASLARFFLESSDEVVELLERMRGRLEARGA
ncbi:trehalose-phosphatase [Caldimonas sp. KR1-144]|uniref:trehalose-phosphatase n=1 Tax=Caldimonas sp. KR1-144 TaxID=3400911 RepID=UPI003C107003